MPIFQLILVLVIVGVIMWAINAYIPMQANIKKILNVAVVIFILIWLLSLFVDMGHLNNIRIGN